MTLAEENAQVLHLVQALIGAVSPNLRWVTLAVPTAGAVNLRFVLEEDRPEDREEIEHIAFEFEAFQAGPIELDVEIIVDRRAVEELQLPGRFVYGRKEHGWTDDD